MAMAQYPVTVSTLYVTDSIAMDTNRIAQVDTAVWSHDAVPLFQMEDSIGTIIIDISALYDSIAIHRDSLNSYYDTLLVHRIDINSIGIEVDASNISQVEFIVNNDTIRESFSHEHLEYAMMTQMLRANDSIDSLRVAINRNNVFEKELSDSEVSILVGFTVSTKSLVFLNGGVIKNSQWSGEGTETIILTLDTKQYDNFLIKQ
jgi:hypothetical protein